LRKKKIRAEKRIHQKTVKRSERGRLLSILLIPEVGYEEGEEKRKKLSLTPRPVEETTVRTTNVTIDAL